MDSRRFYLPLLIGLAITHGLLSGFEKLPDRRTKQMSGPGSLDPAWFWRLIFGVIKRIRSTVTGDLVDGLRTGPFFLFPRSGVFEDQL
jgi:hypothetical protein